MPTQDSQERRLPSIRIDPEPDGDESGAAMKNRLADNPATVAIVACPPVRPANSCIRG